MIEVTLLRVTLRLQVLIRRVASVSFMRTTLMASLVSNALEYFDLTGQGKPTAYGALLYSEAECQLESGHWKKVPPI
jgi:hypothetical protein